eukprot:scaffold15822_cov67-Phaeocystis_antarctica.AAC.1
MRRSSGDAIDCAPAIVRHAKDPRSRIRVPPSGRALLCLRSHQRTKPKSSLIFESHHPEPRTRESKSAGVPESRAREEADPVREPDLWSAHLDPAIPVPASLGLRRS